MQASRSKPASHSTIGAKPSEGYLHLEEPTARFELERLGFQCLRSIIARCGRLCKRFYVSTRRKRGGGSYKSGIGDAPSCVDDLYRRVYLPRMAGNNEDYLRRLKQDVRDDLLEQIETGELSIYGAALIMGYRKRKTASSREGQMTYHWTRASAAEKKLFLKRNFQSVTPMVQKIIAELREKEAKKPAE